MLKHKHTQVCSNNEDSSCIGSAGSEKKLNHIEVPVDSTKMKEGNIVLPQRFVVKYLGVRETSNLWGIKYTRGPVDALVAEAKQLLSTSSSGKTLPLLKLEVAEEGIQVDHMPQNTNPNHPTGKFPIESISYGVQDLVYTRVFAMIVVKPQSSNSITKLSEISKRDKSGVLPFRCHAFVTDTKQTAKNLTLALAQAFQHYSSKVAEGKVKVPKPKKFAIDLRSQKEIEEGDIIDSEA